MDDANGRSHNAIFGDIDVDQAKIIATLNDLIAVSKDGHKGFANAAEHAKAPELKAMLSAYSGRCGSGAAELSALVVSMGGDAKEDGTFAGTMRRGLTDVKAALSSDTDHAILEVCEKGEDVAKKAYADALAEGLPESVRAVVMRQNQEVIEHHDRVRDLRDSKLPDLRDR